MLSVAKIVKTEKPGEYTWTNRPYAFFDLLRDLPEVAREAIYQIPEYDNGCYDINSDRKITCYVHRVINSEAIIQYYYFKDIQTGWVIDACRN